MKKACCCTGTKQPDYDAILTNFQNGKLYHWATVQAEFYMDIVMIVHARGIISRRMCRACCKEIADQIPHLKELFPQYFKARMRRWMGSFSR